MSQPVKCYDFNNDFGYYANIVHFLHEVTNSEEHPEIMAKKIDIQLVYSNDYVTLRVEELESNSGFKDFQPITWERSLFEKRFFCIID